ncbi:MAG: UDP-N-acetylglucosamine 2-epimerase (non-hydrolyzing) [Verrucomicrobiae bacterium]|nr:UDP-N-acetylglucosamine 2-epimerase (non-hydrolyzing) [Verrucomicrobiae bacterium]
MSLFGTRPEIIKFAPVVRSIEAHGMESINVFSGQHTDLATPLIDFFGIRIDHNLAIMREAQTLNGIISRVTDALDEILATAKPDVLLVQGDTSTALGGALAAFNRRIPVGHIEAGLRSGEKFSPFPEELNRRLISKIAAHHFAATERNVTALASESVPMRTVHCTGNTVIDALSYTMKNSRMGDELAELFAKTEGLKRIVLTTHRRESFGDVMEGNLRVLRDYVRAHGDLCLIFPVHPNPNVRAIAESVLGGEDRVHLVQPLPYEQFVLLLSNAWILVSDSGGIQEEAPTLGKPLLIIRDNTERPEAVTCGVGRLVGESPELLKAALDDLMESSAWFDKVANAENPFGDGNAAQRIAGILKQAYSSQPVRN